MLANFRDPATLLGARVERRCFTPTTETIKNGFFNKTVQFENDDRRGVLNGNKDYQIETFEYFKSKFFWFFFVVVCVEITQAVAH